MEPDSQLYSATLPVQDELESIEKNSLISARVGIQWQGHDCVFTDWLFMPTINLWRDYLPAQIEKQLTGTSKGELIQHDFAPGELIDNWSSSLLLEVPGDNFQPPKTGLIPVTAATGRFYPKDFFHHVAGINQGNKFPCRITEKSDSHFRVDFNHPLAGKDIKMMIRIESIKKAGAERGGRCNDIPASICDHGPGMQDRLAHSETDFWSNDPFMRVDSEDDSVFYHRPRLTPFWDKVALQQVSEYYAQHLEPQTHILDLMAGIHSPLQESGIMSASVTAAGLNRQELDENRICTRSVVLDVNTMDRLPFADEEFDAVLIHAAIEYVIKPSLLMAEISRVLTPDGKIIISFSNRSVAEKTIRLWSEAHEFERAGIVLSYLRSAPGFSHFSSYSIRGLLRPKDDELAHKLLNSDTVFIIQAQKSHSTSR